MEVRVADNNDIGAAIDLNRKYLISNLTAIQQERGYLGKEYTSAELEEIIGARQMVVTTDNDVLVGYYLIGRKDDPDALAYKRNTALQLLDVEGVPLTHIAYPTQVCIEAAYRGTGLFGQMLRVLFASVSDRYTILLCSISDTNTASLRAHLINGWKQMNRFEDRVFLEYRL